MKNLTHRISLLLFVVAGMLVVESRSAIAQGACSGGGGPGSNASMQGLPYSSSMLGLNNPYSNQQNYLPQSQQQQLAFMQQQLQYQQQQLNLLNQKRAEESRAAIELRKEQIAAKKAKKSQEKAEKVAKYKLQKQMLASTSQESSSQK